jgi:predicted DNA-binding transcriptional regulator AlpA
VPRYDAFPSGVSPVEPFGLAREGAAYVLGISPSKFDELVKDARMPAPRVIDGRVLWDVEELRVAWRALPRRGEREQDPVSGWDEALKQ